VQTFSDCWLEANSLTVLPPAITTQIFLFLPANDYVVFQSSKLLLQLHVSHAARPI
jgi:hypothetical protein